ncbi:metal-dependent phosphohydrolase [Burkholderia phage BcepSaruman]|uniref:Putative guanosine phosphopryohydrolase n=1 Tax=Burkholderia phage BcepSaruman TaxID=2530032 RepID=A0A4D5ZDR6_9CAUD|nr:metal-dependent phosphohydrolase [Burkholderia phage BcepSaruman]QBX06849.1 putative guanosine phosphopryohydrolase [Burkholderia phage BcepSaruman]
MKIILDAIAFANEKHAGQVRRGSGDPYITHPLAVSYIVAAYKKSKKLPELLAAAILHDILEDTVTTFEELVARFGPLVASIVLELSNDEVQIKILGKLAYQKNKVRGLSSYGLVVKLADRLHNVSDQPTLKMISDTEDLMLSLVRSRKLSKTHKALVAAILKTCQEQKDKICGLVSNA